VNANHFIIAKVFEEEINSPLIGKVKKQLPKQRSIQSSNIIINFFVAKKPS
jgi:hypothetical protein